MSCSASASPRRRPRPRRRESRRCPWPSLQRGEQLGGLLADAAHLVVRRPGGVVRRASSCVASCRSGTGPADDPSSIRAPATACRASAAGQREQPTVGPDGHHELVAVPGQVDVRSRSRTAARSAARPRCGAGDRHRPVARRRGERVVAVVRRRGEGGQRVGARPARRAGTPSARPAAPANDSSTSASTSALRRDPAGPPRVGARASGKTRLATTPSTR